jgi:hypothetical protein
LSAWSNRDLPKFPRTGLFRVETMDFASLERLGALIILIAGAVTGIVKIPEIVLAIQANKKKYRLRERSNYWICWTIMSIAWQPTSEKSRN